MGGKIETASQNNSVSDCHRAVACIRYDSSKQKSSPPFDNFFLSLSRPRCENQRQGRMTHRIEPLKQVLNRPKKGNSQDGLQSPSPWFYYRNASRV
ncbi:hypothetical protein HNO52_13960 [Billgrantia diversa]|uniref:hypothetical protein n=1 Tax=Halomonas sp. MCCC 1A13316 TaxID=2733487 RepID=UPI0018A5F9F6|nr:hypothetical protein [Halomonas sp. MCCC 1A13316]QOR39497.1 hypothetical protein HNO52_13960 [Halomonas sp. MCCC 1A13316]